MKAELMDQSVYKLCRHLSDFLWGLPAVGTGQDRHSKEQALMLHPTSTFCLVLLPILPTWLPANQCVFKT